MDREPEKRLFGMRVVLDDSVPKDEVRMRDETMREILRIIGLREDRKGDG